MDIVCLTVNADDLPFAFISGLDDELERLYLARQNQRDRTIELSQFVSLFRNKTIPDNLVKYFNLLPEDAEREIEFLSERNYTLELNKIDEGIAWVDNAEGITEFFGLFDKGTINSLMEKILASGIPYKDCTRRSKTTRKPPPPVRSPSVIRSLSVTRLPPRRLALSRLRLEEEEF